MPPAVRAAAPLLGLIFVLRAVAAQAPREDQVLILDKPAGTQSISRASDATVRAEFSFNDRGRGDHIVASWKLDAQGVPLEYHGEGHDYHKAAVSETFSVHGGRASWHSRAEQGTREVSGAAFYVPANAPPEFLAVLARALLKAPQQRLPLLPEGEATLQAVPAPAAASGARLYEISGLDFAPTPVWLTADGATFAIVSDWFSTLTPPARAAFAGLRAAQDRATEAWSAQLAREQTRVPEGDVLIRHARLFDPRDLTVTADTSVLVHGAYIVRVLEPIYK